MRTIRIIVLTILGLVVCMDICAQRLDVKGVCKRSKAADCATIIFKSDFDELTVTGFSSDSVYKKKVSGYSHAWVSYVDLRYEHEQVTDSVINRSFRLHTPYTEDLELIVPENGRDLRQAIYEYQVRVIDYFPMRFALEADVIGLKDYFGLRISAGKRWGGYASIKFGENKKGFNADELGDDVDESKKTYMGRICNSYMAGVKYGLVSRDYPVYLYCGAGYGENGIQRSNGKKKDQGRIEYYCDYTKGFESEMGANIVLFNFLSISMGADAIFGHKVAFKINCTLGFSVDLTQ